MFWLGLLLEVSFSVLLMLIWLFCSDKSYVESVVSFLHDVVPQASKPLLFELKNLYFHNVILCKLVYVSDSHYFYRLCLFIFNLQGILGCLKSLNSRNFINNANNPFKVQLGNRFEIQRKNERDYC